MSWREGSRIAKTYYSQPIPSHSTSANAPPNKQHFPSSAYCQSVGKSYLTCPDLPVVVTPILCSTSTNPPTQRTHCIPLHMLRVVYEEEITKGEAEGGSRMHGNRAFVGWRNWRRAAGVPCGSRMESFSRSKAYPNIKADVKFLSKSWDMDRPPTNTAFFQLGGSEEEGERGACCYCAA